MLNGLGPNYQMFTTMTLRSPLPIYSEMLSMLQSYETRILLQDSVIQTQEVAFVANKGVKSKCINQSHFRK